MLWTKPCLKFDIHTISCQNAVKFSSSQTSNRNRKKLTAVVPHVMQCASRTLRSSRNNVALRRLLCLSSSTQTSAAVELGKSAGGGGGGGEFTQGRSYGWRFCGSSAASRIVTIVDGTNPSTLYPGKCRIPSFRERYDFDVWIMVLLHIRLCLIVYVISKWTSRELEGLSGLLLPFKGVHLVCT